MSSRRTTLVVVGLLLAFMAPMSAAYAVWGRTAGATVDVSVRAVADPVLSCVLSSGTTLSWTATGARYHVFESVDGAVWPATPLVQTSLTTFTRTPFPSETGATRWYRVVAVTDSGTSAASNVIRINRTGSTATFTCAGVTS